MIRSLALFLFLGLVNQAVFAQDTIRKRSGKIRKYNNSFITVGLGPVFHYSHDPMASPLIYRASGISYVQAGFRQRGLKRYRIAEFMTGSSTLYNTQSKSYYYQSNQFTLKAHYEQYYKFKKKFLHNHVQWWPGASTDLLINNRYNPALGNSANYYDYSLSLSAASRFETDFKLFKRKIRAAWQLNLPLVTAITRPNYAGIANFVTGSSGETMDQYTDNMRVVCLNQYFLLRSTIELYYPLGNRNMFMLSYQWQGQTYYNQTYKLQSVYSAFMFHFIFKLDKNNNL
jgi:hypothetical protein